MFVADRRQEVLDHIILPIANLAITLYFLCLIVIIIDIKACVVSEISEGHFIETFTEHEIGGTFL